MTIDLDAYFERIGYAGTLRPSVENLHEMHNRHPMAIPFENLSTLLDEPVSLELSSLQRKLLERKRGGYCFEQNSLFAAVLEAFGFRFTALAARVVWNDSSGWVNPRTHMVLRIDIGADYDLIADVGFGGVTLTTPLKLVLGIEQQTAHETFRFIDEPGEFVLQVLLEGRWRSMYRFDLQPQLPIDFEVLNYYVSTHPQSHFLTTLMAAIPTDQERFSLGNNRLSTYSRGALIAERNLESADQIKSVLTDLFKIRLPDGPTLDRALTRIAAPID